MRRKNVDRKKAAKLRQRQTVPPGSLPVTRSAKALLKAMRR
jgi:hypothetical protein